MIIDNNTQAPFLEQKTQTLYLVTAIQYHLSALFSVSHPKLDGPPEEVSATVPMQWAEGMVGAAPVFLTYDAALTYADGHREFISELEVPTWDHDEAPPTPPAPKSAILH